MNGWLRRFSVGLGAAVAGGLVGLFAGSELRAVLGFGLGCLLGFAGVLCFDARRARQLIDWLRGPRHESAPRDAGLWGEIAYRIEKGVRALEHEADAEKTRLAQFVAAMEASPNGVLLLDANDTIEWCNERAAEHFGLDPVRDQRQRVTNLIRSPAFVGYLQAGDYEDAISFAAPRGPGSLRVLIRRYGNDARKLVLSQDQTERERADAMRRDFVANVSHEIRTPLTVLSGFVETLRNLPLSEAEQKRVLTLMTQQTDRMASLVGDLLSLARLEGSPRPPADQWVPVQSLFMRAEASAQALSAGRHEIAFATPGEAQIAGDDSELLSAIDNLVNNAVRYTPDGGRVEVSFQLRGNGSGAIVVADTGRGIAREHLSRLTERFYRVDSGRSRDSGGTGLGLAIVKHVAQRHGGELDVESEPGKGSTFRLILPAVRVRAGPTEPRQPPDESQAADEPVSVAS
ncbi:MAG: phosphate regulon sensor histidine kinase PhoR [Pseudomonadota bacterium]|nr:phosphate regulon sensor histidine kinase PhoR [Pseudomonadota bacterium]